MRDYAMTRAAGFGGAGGSLIRRMIGNWMARRAVARLDSYDDYILRDIGVGREDVRWAASLPLSMNAAAALEERAMKRQRESLEKRPGWGAF